MLLLLLVSYTCDTNKRRTSLNKHVQEEEDVLVPLVMQNSLILREFEHPIGYFTLSTHYRRFIVGFLFRKTMTRFLK